MKGVLKNRTFWFLALCSLVIAGMLLWAPKQVDWTPSFNRADKRPFGDYLLFGMLKKEVFDDRLTVSDVPLFNFTQTHSGLTGSNLIIITPHFSPDPLDCESLLGFVARGNNVFIAAYQLPAELQDTLGVTLLGAPALFDRERECHFRYFNPALDTAGFRLQRVAGNFHFYGGDSICLTALGSADGRINFVQVPFGAGHFYLHASPYLFTNYALLQKHAAEGVLQAFAYLSQAPSFWDEYYKPERDQLREHPLQYLFRNNGLRQAYFTFLAGVLLFFLFRSKRLQRPIPVITPPANTSKEFAQTLGYLHFNKKENAYIIDLKFRHLLDYIRNRYYMDTSVLDNRFVLALEQRSGVEAKYIRRILDKYKALDVIVKPGPEFLTEFSEAVDFFYARCR